MTTVCWDGKKLAADTLYSAGGRKLQGHYEKIIFAGEKPWTVEGKKVLVFGFSGGIGTVPKIKTLLEAGVTHNTVPDVGDNSFSILMVTEDKEVYSWTVGLSAQKEQVNDLFITDGNVSIGSGGIYGLGVMAIKGNAVDAVKAAMKVDLHSGGYIDVWEFDKPTTLTRVSPDGGEIVFTKQYTPPPIKVEAEEEVKDAPILCTSGD